MAHTYEALKKMTVAQLRKIAEGLDHPAVKGYTQLNKAHLIPAICTALGIDAHEHHVAHGAQKSTIKAQIRALKRQRDAILSSDDKGELKKVRAGIHRLRKKLRKMID